MRRRLPSADGSTRGQTHRNASARPNYRPGDETVIQNVGYGVGIPLGFGLALAQNPDAMDVFAGLTEAQRRQVIEKTGRIRSREEMRSYVDSLVDPGWQPSSEAL